MTDIPTVVETPVVQARCDLNLPQRDKFCQSAQKY